jgi:hypothetical protein
MSTQKMPFRNAANEIQIMFQNFNARTLTALEGDVLRTSSPGRDLLRANLRLVYTPWTRFQ